MSAVGGVRARVLGVRNAHEELNLLPGVPVLAVLGGTLAGCGDDTNETTVVGGAPCGPATCAETEYCCFDPAAMTDEIFGRSNFSRSR